MTQETKTKLTGKARELMVATSDVRIPVVCADKTSIAGAEVFNPNAWTGESKGIVQSCWTEYSVLHHCASQIEHMCRQGENLCASQIQTIQQQWRASKFDLGKVIIFGQQPDLHIRIEAFLAGMKTLLDLLVQLLSSEKVVGAKVDGFHRVRGVYGGKVLNSLENNGVSDRKVAATKLITLISEHKVLWIDDAIFAPRSTRPSEYGNESIDVSTGIQRGCGSTVVCSSPSARNQLSTYRSLHRKDTEARGSILIHIPSIIT